MKAYKPVSPYKKQLDTPLLQQKEYSITKSEWVVGNREIINEGNNAGVVDAANAALTLYTVPKNARLFITHAYLNNQVVKVGNAHWIIFLRTATQEYIFADDVSAVSLVKSNYSTSFNQPFRVEPNGKIELIIIGVGTTGDVNASAGFLGYLERF